MRQTDRSCCQQYIIDSNRQTDSEVEQAGRQTNIQMLVSIISQTETDGQRGGEKRQTEAGANNIQKGSVRYTDKWDSQANRQIEPSSNNISNRDRHRQSWTMWLISHRQRQTNRQTKTGRQTERKKTES